MYGRILLDAFLAAQKMDVVNQENVNIPEMIPEARQVFPDQGVNILIAEFLAADVFDARLGKALQRFLRDSVQQVGLAQSGRTVNEQRIIGGARRGGNSQASPVRKAAVVSNDKGVKGVAFVEPQRRRRLPEVWFSGCCRGGDRRHGFRYWRLFLSSLFLRELDCMPALKNDFPLFSGRLSGGLPR